jgi:hypothetical protein
MTMKLLAPLALALSLVCPPLADAQDAANQRRLVTIDVLIAELGPDTDASKDLTAKTLLEYEKDGKLAHATRARLMSVEDQSAMVQLGERVPVVTGRTLTGRGGGFFQSRPERTGEAPREDAGPRFTSSYTYENIGTIVSATPRLESGDSILIELRIEKSRLAHADHATEGAASEEFGRHKTVSLTCQSTVRVRGDEPILVEGFRAGSPKDARGQYIVLSASAEVAPPASERAVEARKAEGQLRVFALRNANANEAVKLLMTIYGSRALRAAADSRTNSVIVYGQTADASGLEALLQRLDETQAADDPNQEAVRSNP